MAIHPMKYSSRSTDWQSAEEHLPVIWTTRPDLAVAQTCQESNYLDGLAQSHLVSQNSSHLLAVQFPEPPNTCLLVPARKRAKSDGKQEIATGQTHELVICNAQKLVTVTCCSMCFTWRLYLQRHAFFMPLDVGCDELALCAMLKVHLIKPGHDNWRVFYFVLYKYC